MGVAMRWLLLLVAVALSCCVGCGRRADSVATDGVAAVSRAEVTLCGVDSLMASMSVEERVGQLFMPACFTVADAATVRRLVRYVADEKVGGIVFLRGDTASMLALSRMLRGHARVPLFLAMDAEWGLGMRLRDAECFPHNSRLSGASEAQMYDYGVRVGTQASRLGLNMILGPVLDVASSGASVMADRSYGGDPAMVADLGVAYARGLRDGGVYPVAKHFPGHGSTSVDSHRALPVIVRGREALDSIDLLPFRRYVDQGFPAVMAGHMAVPALSGDSVPASVSPAVLTGVLREAMGFGGLVLTDAMNMDAVGASSGVYVASLLAGADIILVPGDTRGAIDEVIGALRDGSLPAWVVNDRCRRVLLYKSYLGDQ